MMGKIKPAIFNISMTAVLFSLLLFFSGYGHGNLSTIKQIFTPPTTSSSDTVAHWQKLLKGGHRDGLANAPVQIVEFSDFQCPYCKEMVPIIRAMQKKYGKKIAITYYNYPLRMHPQSMLAAEAAECAAKEGKYLEYHKLLFANQKYFSKLPWDSLAHIVRIRNIKKFNGCMKSKAIFNIVKSDVQLGNSVNVIETPTFIINGIKFNGTMKKDKMDSVINNMLKHKG